MLCENCHRREAVISIKGEGNFCLECSNQRMLRRCGCRDDFHYARTICVREGSGKLHPFHLQHVIIGNLVSWEAQETGGGYFVHSLSALGDSTREVVRRFQKKITDTVLNKTLVRVGDEDREDSVLRHGGRYALRRKGNIGIESAADGSVFFVIDGERFTPQEFARLVRPMEGMNMQFQFHNDTDEPLRRSELLIPTNVDGAQLLDEWRMDLSLHQDRSGWVSEEEMLQFVQETEEIYRRLQAADDAGEPFSEAARRAGAQMIDTLKQLNCESRELVESQIAALRNIIDPIGIYLDADDHLVC